MSIKLFFLHEHELCFSYFREVNKNNRYLIKGWFECKNKDEYNLEENDYINLECGACNYKYISETKVKIYSTNQAHTLYSNSIGSYDQYTIDGQKIVTDNTYSLKDYYLIKNEYQGVIYIGNEQEIRNYFYSEMIKYKNLYNEELSKNKRLDYNIREKNKEINNLNSNINKLNKKVENLNKELFEEKIRTQSENLELKKENNKLKEVNEDLKSFGIKYNTENGKGDYDIILCVDSIRNLTNKGWAIKYNKKEGKSIYEELKHNKTIVVGVVGNGNKGKSFLLKKLSNYDIPMGFNVKTEGLSIIYGKTEKQNLAILDSAGQETPLLIENKKEKSTEGNKKDSNEDQLEFEEYSRDKLITEFYIQQFILWKSNIVILLVGSITLSEQKLYARIKSELLAIQENKRENKKLYVVHNLQNFYLKDDVNDYIENTLKKLYNVELEELRMYDPNNEITGYDKYFLEKDNKNIIHLLFINDYCDYSTYYNRNTIWYLTHAIAQEPSRQTFEILENSRDFLLTISDEILENRLLKDNIEIVMDEDTQTEKLIIKNIPEIQLKKFIVDEMGITKNDGNTPKYSYYIETQKSKLVVNIELPGGGCFEDPEVKSFQGYYSFRFEGEQKGELMPKFNDNETKEDYQELEQEKQASINLAKNLRKKHHIHIEFKISNQVIQLKYNDNVPEYTTEITPKGIIIFIFSIVLLNKNSGEKKIKKKIQF